MIFEFSDFLEKKGCLAEYKRNMTASLYGASPEYFFETFDFEKTQEGYDFWNNLKQEWLSKLKRENYEDQV